MVNMSDQEIESLETQFPAASGSAFAAAREQTLASGQSVLEIVEGSLYLTFPDGSRQLVKKIDPPFAVTPGTIINIR